MTASVLDPEQDPDTQDTLRAHSTALFGVPHHRRGGLRQVARGVAPVPSRARGRAAVPQPRTAPDAGPPTTDPGIAGPFAELAGRMTPLCASAVDVLEIAAGLESEGLNDAAVRRLYGDPDVFALAERLWDAVPRNPVSPPPEPSPWAVRPAHHALRGLLFGLPGLPFVAAAGLLRASGAIGVIVVSLLVAWAASEALSFLGYSALGRSQAESAWVLRRGLAATLAAVTPAVAVAAAALGAGIAAGAFAAGQAVYLLAATAVLVTGGERWLLGALLPSVTGSALVLSGALPPTVAGGGAGVSVLLTVALAVLRTRGGERPPAGSANPLGTLPYVAFGLLAGGLLSFGAVYAMLRPGSPGGVRAGAATALPITLSMGAAEWLLFRYRAQLHGLAGRAGTLTAFTRRARLALAGAVGGYLAILAGLTALVSAAGTATGAFTLGPGLAATSVALGGALFTALVLRSFGFAWIVLTGCAAALGGQLAALAIAPALPVARIQLAAALGLFLLLLPVALTVLGRATPHR